MIKTPIRSTVRVFNSWDALKLLALTSMLIDHTSFFFFPEQLWMRAVGRIAAPIFFFLIGAAMHSRVSIRLLLTALFLIGFRAFFFSELLVLPILFTLLLCQYITIFEQKKPWEWLIVLVIFTPSLLFFEYGTIGLLFTLAGRLWRDGRREFRPFLAITQLVYGSAMILAVNYNVGEMLLVWGGQIGLFVLFTRFKLKTYSLPLPLCVFLRFTARHSLSIYTLQTVALMALTGKVP